MLNQNRNISPNFNKDFSPLKMNIEINGKNHLLKDLDNKNNNISLNLTKPSTEQISNQSIKWKFTRSKNFKYN